MEEKVIALINEFIDKYYSSLSEERKFFEPICLNDSIEDDLGIYGDDAEELIIYLSQKLDFDISDFDMHLYFKGEGDRIMQFITYPIRVFIGRKKWMPALKSEKKSLKVIDIVTAAHKGHLK